MELQQSSAVHLSNPWAGTLQAARGFHPWRTAARGRRGAGPSPAGAPMGAASRLAHLPAAGERSLGRRLCVHAGLACCCCRQLGRRRPLPGLTVVGNHDDIKDALLGREDAMAVIGCMCRRQAALPAKHCVPPPRRLGLKPALHPAHPCEGRQCLLGTSHASQPPPVPQGPTAPRPQAASLGVASAPGRVPAPRGASPRRPHGCSAHR